MEARHDGTGGRQTTSAEARTGASRLLFSFIPVGKSKERRSILPLTRLSGKGKTSDSSGGQGL